ncbi:SRPBCC domain-containing protein [Bdellovibrio bacteriovorus]|uniref:SRPBCC domain-containing protein n=1 Tax=Bdellovibrio bacteriovorus TaxID=959 RepID=UPI0021D1DC29|nr:SRPBCC domain-containing protein [Bdellovibrio bacteriovorus]UXR65993.1 SRPBCC domain-containing protein [Bdellovibrio bacteriovorus]
MIPKFEVTTIIQKPVSEVFDAVYNPKKISGYFTTAGASAPLVEGTTVQWEFADFPGPFPVVVKQTVQNKLLVIEWEASEGGYNTQTEFIFEELNPRETKVKISETGWKETEKGVISSYQNCQGWAQMASAMKAYLEYGINLRTGAYKALYS